MIKSVLEDLVNPNFFGFDYAVFSEADNYYDYICVKDHLPRCVEMNWTKQSHYRLFADMDVTAYAVVNGKHLFVNGKNAYELQMQNLNHKKKASNVKFNEIIFKKANHSNYTRVFFPIMRLLPKAEETYGIGVIEAGKRGRYPINQTSEAFEKSDPFNKNNLSELALYTDNLAQPFLRNALDELKANIDNRLEKIDKKHLRRSSQYKSLLQELLSELVIEVNGVLGVMSFITMHRELKNPVFEPSVRSFEGNEIEFQRLQERIPKTNDYSSDKEDSSDNQSFIAFRKIWFKREAEHINPDIYKEYQDYYKKDGSDIKEVLLLPLMHSGYLIGICKIYSNRINHFKAQKINFCTNFLKKAIPVILRKKMDYFVSQIVKPISLVNSKVNNNNLFIKSLEQYFLTPYVSISSKGNSSNFKQRYFSEALKDIDYSLGHFPMERQIININEEEHEELFNLGFRKMLRIPLEFQTFQFGFIEILSKRAFNTILIDESRIDTADYFFGSTRNYLYALSYKICLSIQNYKLNELVAQINKKTANLPIKETIKESLLFAFIIQKSKSILFADHIDIFSYNSTSDEIEHFNEEHPKIDLMLYADSMMRDEIEELSINKSDGHIIISAPIIVQKNVKGVLIATYKAERLETKSFEESTKKLASSISPAKLLIDNVNQKDRLFQQQFEAIKPMFDSTVILGNMHNICKNFGTLGDKFKLANSSMQHASNKDKGYIAQDFMKTLEKVLRDLDSDLRKLDDYYQNRNIVSLKYLHVNSLVDETIESLDGRDEAKRINITAIHTDQVGLIADFDILRNVIINLVINALQAINLKRTGDSVKIEVKLNPKKRYCIIRVEDNGPGIDPSIKDKLFEPRVTTRKSLGGTGFGLAISKYAIEVRHNGYLKNLQATKGAIFEIWLKYNKNEDRFTD